MDFSGITFNPLDIISAIILLIFICRSTFRGFISEFSSLAAIVIGLLIASIFSGIVAEFILEQFIGKSIWNQVIAFLLLFIVSYLIVKLFESGLKSLITRIHLQKLDKAIGFFYGILEGSLFVFLFIFILQLFPLPALRETIASSFVGLILSPLFPYAIEFINRGINA